MRLLVLLLTGCLYSDSILSFGGGVFNVLRESNKSGMVQLEYKGQPFWGKKYVFIRPYISAMGTFQGSLYACGGVAFDIPLGCYAYVTPSFGSGFYLQNGGKNLGYPVENRSAIEFGGVFPNRSRLGVQFYHLSNGSIARKNPGAECLLLQYSIVFN
jgi:lipid A 3-O-deacylase